MISWEIQHLFTGPAVGGLEKEEVESGKTESTERQGVVYFV